MLIAVSCLAVLIGGYSNKCYQPQISQLSFYMAGRSTAYAYSVGGLLWWKCRFPFGSHVAIEMLVCFFLKKLSVYLSILYILLLLQ